MFKLESGWKSKICLGSLIEKAGREGRYVPFICSRPTFPRHHVTHYMLLIRLGDSIITPNHLETYSSVALAKFHGTWNFRQLQSSFGVWQASTRVLSIRHVRVRHAASTRQSQPRQDDARYSCSRPPQKRSPQEFKATLSTPMLLGALVDTT